MNREDSPARAPYSTSLTVALPFHRLVMPKRVFSPLSWSAGWNW